MSSGIQRRQPEQWATRIGVILAVAGSAVGLGNFLRFPGQAAQNGGGAFMIPYFISLLVLGIPLCWAEWTMGRYGGTRGFNSAPGIYRSVGKSRFSMYFGSVALLLPLIVYMYYVLIEAWCLGYAVNYLTGDLMLGSGGTIDEMAEAVKRDATEPLTDSEVASGAFTSFFNDFVGANEDGWTLGGRHRVWLLVLAGTFLMNFIFIYRGISKGIETFCRFAMPLMIVLGLIVLARVLTLGTPDPAKPAQSVAGGLNFMWDPDFRALWNPQTWLAASGQVFFTLSVGFGIIINYASYLRKKDDVVLSGLTASSMNEFFEVCLGGMITLPAAFIFLGAAAGEQGTFDLGFKALPNVFTLMPGGRLFGFLWFFMLFIAAITSSVSMLQPVIAFFEEGFGLKRHASVAILGLIAALGTGFVLWFSKGLTALDMFDFWVGTFLIFVLATFQAVLYGWLLGIERGEAEAHEGAHIRIPRFVQYMLKYVVPVYLGLVFIGFCWSDLPSSEAPAFESSVSFTEATDGQTLSPDLQSEFTSRELELPESPILEKTDDGTGWAIKESPDGAPQFVLREVISESSGQRVLFVNAYKMGKVETILRNNVALASVGFIGTVLVFLLVLIHIAGQRWQAEGRFDGEHTPTEAE